MKFLTQFFILSLQSLYLYLKSSYMIVFVLRDQLQIIYSIIVFNTIFVMNSLPKVKISPKMFCHHKTMFKAISTFGSRWSKEIIAKDSSLYITIPSCYPTAFPKIIKFSYVRFKKVFSFFRSLSSKCKYLSTATTPRICRSPSNLHPSCFATIWTGMHNILIFSVSTYIETNFYITNIKHNLLYAIQGNKSRDKLCKV